MGHFKEVKFMYELIIKSTAFEYEALGIIALISLIGFVIALVLMFLADLEFLKQN
jgi:hypothetical protein